MAANAEARLPRLFLRREPSSQRDARGFTRGKYKRATARGGALGCRST
jgi:hypothetical protein